MPDWAGSIRFRLTILYSAVLFGIAALLVVALYAGLNWKLRQQPLSDRVAVNQFFQAPDGTIIRLERLVISEARAFERAVNRNTLDQLRNYSLIALPGLFGLSLAVGWIISGRVLSPIGRIGEVARQIQATDLSKRIELSGPRDELRDLAETFDQMLDRIEDAFTSQSRFVADASHELRNPLAVIRTNLDVALDDPDATVADLREAAHVARRAGDRMGRMVDDLLLLARLEAPKESHAGFALDEVISGAIGESKAAAEQKGVLLAGTATTNATVTGDGDAATRAISNLLDNAMRVSPAGKRIELDSGTTDGWAWIAIADEGPGIAPEHHERIFDRFYRADASRSRDQGGTGLGLAIVKRIMEAHGGEVRLASIPGRGTTVVLWFPTTSEHGDVPPQGSPQLLR